jgi:UMF1 family MFS transporter
VFAVPSIFLLPPAPGRGVSVRSALRQGGVEVVAGVRAILRDRELRRFFGAYFVYEDGVNTVVAFSAVFAAQTLGFPMDRLIVLYIVVQISALLGALAWSSAIDRIGPRPVVMVTLAQWVGVVVAAFFVQTQTQFYVVAVVAGTGLGAVQAASRTLLAILIPKGMEAELFGFYALCGKSAAIMGPLVFGTVSYAGGGNQRLGILMVGVFFVIGLALLTRVRAGVGRGAPRVPAGPGTSRREDPISISRRRTSRPALSLPGTPRGCVSPRPGRGSRPTRPSVPSPARSRAPPPPAPGARSARPAAR